MCSFCPRSLGYCSISVPIVNGASTKMVWWGLEGPLVNSMGLHVSRPDLLSAHKAVVRRYGMFMNCRVFMNEADLFFKWQIVSYVSLKCCLSFFQLGTESWTRSKDGTFCKYDPCHSTVLLCLVKTRCINISLWVNLTLFHLLTNVYCICAVPF